MSWAYTAVTVVVAVASQVQSGRVQKKTYKIQAKQAEREAKADSINAKRDLNRTLAMQNAMFAASGRAAGEGSAQLIQLKDIERGKDNITLIKEGGKGRSHNLKQAGKMAKQRSLIEATSTAVGAGAKYKQVQ